MYHTIGLINKRINTIKKHTNILKLIILVLIIWNTSLTITQAKQTTIKQNTQTLQPQEILNLQDLPQVPPIEDIRIQVIDNESI